MTLNAICDFDSNDSIAELTLVVDDDPIAAEELADALEMAGTPCLVAHSWAGAAEIFLANPSVTAVVTDFYLSGQKVGYRNGLDLVDQLRGFDPTRQLTCLIVSGDVNVEADCAMSRQTGFLPKPAGPHQVIRMLTGLKNRSGDAGHPVRPDADQRTILHDTLADQATGLVGAASLLRMMAQQSEQTDLADLTQLVLERSVALDRSLQEILAL